MSFPTVFSMTRAKVIIFSVISIGVALRLFFMVPWSHSQRVVQSRVEFWEQYDKMYLTPREGKIAFFGTRRPQFTRHSFLNY